MHSPEEQTTPHAPQFVALDTAVSQPFAGLASQLPKPAEHAVMVHTPETHEVVALLRAQREPQAPQ
jgi:hypothetical protein